MQAETGPSSATLKSASRHLDVIDECIRQVKVIADDLLNLSRLEIGHNELRSEPFSLKRFFGSLATIFGAAMELRQFHIDMSVPEVWLRAVSVSLESVALVVVVQDSGPGMDTAQLARLFERFAHSDSGGAGVHGGGSGMAVHRQAPGGRHGRIAGIHQRNGPRSTRPSCRAGRARSASAAGASASYATGSLKNAPRAHRGCRSHGRAGPGSSHQDDPAEQVPVRHVEASDADDISLQVDRASGVRAWKG